ncbi:MAG: formylglycine-generating enzyme family protein [Spirochaetes bacterium]|nr:formylglycine-generating enzyme family protein [Spirochaetota bacterium]
MNDRIHPPVLAGFIVATLLLAWFGACEAPRGAGGPCGGMPEPEGMRCVPGGSFIRGSDAPSADEDTGMPVTDESPRGTVAVSAFFMDIFEVTYRQYHQCMEAGACSFARPYYSGYDRPSQPMLGVTWFQARDYCRWRGKRLPTEAEWERAARGEAGETFPWGNDEADCSRAVIEEKGKKGCGKGTTWEVGSKKAGRYGLHDMVGNSWEWVQDWYSENYSRCGAGCAGQNPKGPCDGADSCPGHERKVLRGGSWWWSAAYARGSNRRPHYPKNVPFHHVGFRCAKNASP